MLGWHRPRPEMFLITCAPRAHSRSHRREPLPSRRPIRCGRRRSPSRRPRYRSRGAIRRHSRSRTRRRRQLSVSILT